MYGNPDQVLSPISDQEYEYYYDVVDGDSSYYRKYPGKTLKEIMAIEAEMYNIRPSIFKAPAEIRKQIDLAPEYMQLVMQVEYKGKKNSENLRRSPDLAGPAAFCRYFEKAYPG